MLYFYCFLFGHAIKTLPNQRIILPSNPSPNDGTASQSIDVDLSWAGGDPDGDPVVYDVCFGTSSPPSLVSNDQTGTTYDPGTLIASTQYYWHIVSKDNHGAQAENIIWTFTTESSIQAPQNLTIIADSEGDGVILSWSQVSWVDGYDLYTPDGDTIFLGFDISSYNDDTPFMTGTYFLHSVFGQYKSDPVTISSAPYMSTYFSTIYVWSNPTEPSGFGWDVLTGIGTVYECNSSNQGVVDFYLNDTLTPFDFTSADEVPYQGNKTTHIRNMGSANFYIAPSVGYHNTETATDGNYYAFSVEGYYFAKVYVVSISPNASATICYWFQTIQGLRIF